jgi:hypothetical protein
MDGLKTALHRVFHVSVEEFMHSKRGDLLGLKLVCLIL